MYVRKWSWGVLLLVLALSLASCDVNITIGGAAATPTTLAVAPPATLPPTSVPPATEAPPTATATPLPPTATPLPPTSVPPTTVPPTSRPNTAPSPQRIQFDSGAMSKTVNGQVAANGANVYVLRALAGQTMTADLLSPATDVLLEIWGQDGTVLKRHVDGETTWTGALPSTQDYFIKVVSFGSAVRYSLTVTIPPLGQPEPVPVRIQFAAGAISKTETGHVPAYGADLYVLRALAGQTMSVDLYSPASDVVLEIWGADGSPLLRHVTGQTTWTGRLYATQDYYIEVVSFGSAVNYSLTVTIPPR